MNKIIYTSIFFRVTFQMLFVAMPALLLISWIYAPNEVVLLFGLIKANAIPGTYSGLHTYSNGGIPENVILHTLTNLEKVWGFLVSSIPLLFKLLIVYNLIRLFKLYEKDDIFSIQHVQYIRNIGYALFFIQVIEPFYQLAMGCVLTLNNPPGHRFMSITLDQANIGILLTSLLVILISWIMAEGLKLREEQRLTV